MIRKTKLKHFLQTSQFLVFVEPINFFSKHHKHISFSFLLGHLQVQGWNNTERINFLDRITQANKMQTEKKNSFLFFLANIITYILSRNLHSKVIFPRHLPQKFRKHVFVLEMSQKHYIFTKVTCWNPDIITCFEAFTAVF